MFSRRRFLQADAITAEGLKEIVWLTPDGREMTEARVEPALRALPRACISQAAPSSARDRRGRPVKDNNFLLLFNAHHEPIEFRIAEKLSGKSWSTVLDTANAEDPFAAHRIDSGSYATQGPLARAPRDRLRGDVQSLKPSGLFAALPSGSTLFDKVPGLTLAGAVAR